MSFGGPFNEYSLSDGAVHHGTFDEKRVLLGLKKEQMSIMVLR